MGTSERWRPIKGFLKSRHYEVSDRGRVRGLLRRNFEPRLIAQRGKRYLGVHLRSAENTKHVDINVHVLVARAFCGKQPTPKHEVNHRDLDKKHNHYRNLEWTTHKQNIQHFHKNGYQHGLIAGEKNPMAVLTNEQVLEIRSHYTGTRGEIAQFSREYGISYAPMWMLVNGKHWQDAVATL